MTGIASLAKYLTGTWLRVIQRSTCKVSLWTLIQLTQGKNTEKGASF
jgi:hypothetical protein